MGMFNLQIHGMNVRQVKRALILLDLPFTGLANCYTSLVGA